jgi:hypothetical protein
MKDTRKTIQLTTASNKIKFLGISLSKEVQGLYNESYKTL